MLVVYATFAYALLLIAFGFTTSLWLGVLILAGLGASDAVGMATRQTTVQLTTDDNMRGRAVSFSSVSAMTANNLGTFEVGIMSEAIGAATHPHLGRRHRRNRSHPSLGIRPRHPGIPLSLKLAPGATPLTHPRRKQRPKVS